jgi:hypothetical protein
MSVNCQRSVGGMIKNKKSTSIIFFLSILQFTALIIFMCTFIKFNNIKASSQSVQRTPEIQPTLTPSKAPLMQIMPPEPKKSVALDLNGDGRPEPIDIFLNYDSDIYAWKGPAEPGYRPFVKTVVEGNEIELELDVGIIKKADFFPFKLDNKQALGIIIDVGGTNSFKLVDLITFNNEKLELLQVPTIKLSDKVSYIGKYDSYKLLDNYKIEVRNKFNDSKDVVQVKIEPEEEGFTYDSDGKVLVESQGIIAPPNSISIAKDNETDLIKFVQHLYGTENIYVGCLESFLAWDEENGLKIVQQEVDLY